MCDKKSIFNKINQVSLLANEIRFKLVLALFNSDMRVGSQKIGSNSHTFTELSSIVNVEGPDLNYHISILKSSNLIEKDKKVYHITDTGKNVLKMFGVNSTMVRAEIKKLQ